MLLMLLKRNENRNAEDAHRLSAAPDSNHHLYIQIAHRELFTRIVNGLTEIAYSVEEIFKHAARPLTGFSAIKLKYL